VKRFSEKLISLSDLHYFAQVHHGYPGAHMFDDAQVV
jgi:hypothetical protein